MNPEQKKKILLMLALSKEAFNLGEDVVGLRILQAAIREEGKA
jgi:hypothetical protein